MIFDIHELVKSEAAYFKFQGEVFFSASKMVDKIICKVCIPVVKSCYFE